MNLLRPQIAVVDDEDSVRKALERLLRSAGMEVETFASGADFLAAGPGLTLDCVVLDLHMPRVSGFEVQRQLAALTHKVSVVVITGHDTPESRARALAGGAFAYLLKPVDEQVLLDAIAAAISSKGL
ncbi:MAG: response regulator [Azoarcus sp.]|nr:response regulator [Azoarcus sp.]